MSIEQLDLRFVKQHRGQYREFVDRYELAARAASAGSHKNYVRFCEDLLQYLADERNLMAAVDHLRDNGGPAPGPDGLRISDLPRMVLWMLVRELRDELLDRQYKRGPLRRCQIQKHLGSPEKRCIYLYTLADRIVARAALQIMTPLLQSLVDPLSFCWRRRGRHLALAFAKRHLVEEGGNTTWITEDARHAFDRVNRQRMLQILCHYIPNAEFCRLILELVEPPTTRGILQGASLSLLLLDLYFSHFIHRPWRKENLPPLARYVDDCLVTLEPQKKSAGVYERLSQYLHNAGMQPKHGFPKAVYDLRHETAHFLGYQLRLRRGQLELRCKLFEIENDDHAHQTHELLFSRFARLHEMEQGWRHQNSVLRGIIAHLAPTWPFVDPKEIYAQLASAASEAGFEDIWKLPQVLERWSADHQHWQSLCARAPELVLGPSRPAGEAEMWDVGDATDIGDSPVPPWE